MADLPLEASLTALGAASAVAGLWGIGKWGWSRSRIPAPVIHAVRRGFWALIVRPRGRDEARQVQSLLYPGAWRVLPA